MNDPNGLTFGLEDQDNFLNLHLYDSIRGSLEDSPESLNTIQCTMICLLNRLLLDDIFINSVTSLNTPHELQTSLLSHARIGPPMHHIVYSEDRALQYISELWPELAPTIASHNLSPSSDNPMQPPHVSRVAETSSPEVEKMLSGHMIQKTRGRNARNSPQPPPRVWFCCQGHSTWGSHPMGCLSRNLLATSSQKPFSSSILTITDYLASYCHHTWSTRC